MQLEEIEKLNNEGLLEKQITRLLNHNNRRLIDLLYRLDVGEEKAADAMQSKKAGPAKSLTKLILERCKQILHSRAKYSSNKGKQWEEV